MMIQQFADTLLPSHTHTTRPLTCGSQYCILYNTDVTLCVLSLLLFLICLSSSVCPCSVCCSSVLFSTLTSSSSTYRLLLLSACLSVKQWQWRCQETIIQFRRQTLKRRLKNNDTRLKRWWSILLSVQGAVFPTPFLAFFFCCGGGERFLLSGIQQPDERTDGAQDAAPAVLALCCCCK